MAAEETLSQSLVIQQIPKHGVLTLYGFGIRVSMQSGHLCIEDGIGPERRHFRLPRVGHGLQRLIVIGSDGFVTLAALRWLADQKAAFVMLERDGEVLITTGPVRPSDARLRRAQALAEHSGAALSISRELISRKLLGQESVVREGARLLDTPRPLRLFDSSGPKSTWLKRWMRSVGLSRRERQHIGPCGGPSRSASQKVIYPGSPVTGGPSIHGSRCYRDRSV